MGFYPIRGEEVINFPENSNIESFIDFLMAIRAINDDYKAIIVVLDNFSTHVSNRVKKEAKQLGIYLVYLPPYSPDLNPIEFVWKSIKRVISILFVDNVEVLKRIIERTFSMLAESLSFAKSWIEKFIPSWI
jgi:transposase